MLSLRIAILNITAGGLSGGYKKYLNRMLPRLVSHPLVESLLVAIPSTEQPDSIVVNTHLPSQQITWITYRPTLLGKVSTLKLNYEVARFNPAIIFVPTARAVRVGNVITVTMIQNMEPLAYDGPNPFSERLVNLVRREEAKRAVRKADRVIAVSHYVKQYLIERWGLPGRKIGVVYHGNDQVSEGDRPNSVPNKWSGRFLFTAGSIRPARGIEDVLCAFAALDAKDECAALVIAGEATRTMNAYLRELKRMAVGLGIAENVIWTGNLNERQMAWCYQNCSAFVMTSRVESFGQIALEAMAHGCLCISADNPCLPEIFADAAVYYPPKNAKALCEVIRSLLTWNDEKRKEMSMAAKKRAEQFSWDTCAEKTLEELKKAIGSSNERGGTEN